MEVEKILKRLVRVGTVTDVNRDKRMARVKFPDKNMSSGWLYVLAARPFIPDYDGAQRTAESSGGEGDAAFAGHAHDLTVLPWMPRVNATVLTLYLPVSDGDGFILGEIGGKDQIKQ